MGLTACNLSFNRFARLQHRSRGLGQRNRGRMTDEKYRQDKK
jgi:hypothetical protein